MHPLPLPLRRQITLALVATVLLLGLALLSSYHYQHRNTGVAANPWLDAPRAETMAIVGRTASTPNSFRIFAA